MPEKVDTVALQSYRRDDAPRSLVKPQRPAGGRRTDPDEEFERQFEELASRWCTGEEIAAVLGMSQRRLDEYLQEKYDISLREAVKRFSARGRASLKRIQWKMVEEDKSVAMAIFLGKNQLDQADEPKQLQGRPSVSIVMMPAVMNPGDWQVQMSELEATRQARIAQAMEAAGLLIEAGDEEALDPPMKRVGSNREL